MIEAGVARGSRQTALSMLRAVTPDSGRSPLTTMAIDRLLALEVEELKRFRRQVQFIFQDPFGSLNPRMTLMTSSKSRCDPRYGDALSRREMVHELVTLVGLDLRHVKRYPHSFSGGSASVSASPGSCIAAGLVICDERLRR